MTYLLFILLVALLVIILKMQADNKANHTQSQLAQNQLKNQLLQIQKKLNEITEGQISIGTPPSKPEKAVEPQKETIEIKPLIETPKVIELPVVEPQVERETPIAPVEESKKQEKPEPTIEKVIIRGTIDMAQAGSPVVKAPVKPKKAEIDYEKYIGENLVSKIGIAILVLAIGFFVKYAIDNDWIGPVGRVCIGLLCGGILVGLAHRLRKDYAAFTSVLVGGGLAIFYFTIALAYHQYHLFDQTVSFGIMVVITIFAVVLSLLYDRQELAVISMVGGYATPFMVSNGSGNYIALLSYLCILNTGLLAIAYMRIWRVLNVLAFIFTVLIFNLWLFTLHSPLLAGVYANAFIFATVFFLFFFIAAIANNIKENKKFLPMHFSILLANSIQYFGIGLYLLTEMKCNEYRGLFSACMAAFHLLVSFFLFRRQNADKNILYLLIGITLTFISITAPLQLDGNFITLFWASESVVLLWLYQRSGIRIISLGSTIVWSITLISLALVFGNNYTSGTSTVGLHIIANKAFVSGIYVGLCTAVLFFLQKRTTTLPEEERSKSLALPPVVFLIAAVVVFFITGTLEIVYQFDRLFEISLSGLYFMLYMLVFASALIYIVKRYEWVKLSPIALAVIASVLIGIHMISLPALFETYHEVLLQHKYVGYFAAHWVSAAIVAGLIYMLIAQLKKAENIQNAHTLLTWGIGTLVILFLSSEFYFAVFGIFYHGPTSEASIDNVFIKACLPIIWGVGSFCFMWIGMRDRFRPLRVFSLVLFSITLLKLFAYDISNVPVAGKIAAFFCLGVMLLVVSFMYQRLKKLIIQDGENKEN